MSIPTPCPSKSNMSHGTGLAGAWLRGTRAHLPGSAVCTHLGLDWKKTKEGDTEDDRDGAPETLQLYPHMPTAYPAIPLCSNGCTCRQAYRPAGGGRRARTVVGARSCALACMHAGVQVAGGVHAPL